MRLGIFGIAFLFFCGGYLYLAHPGRGWAPPKDDPEAKPPATWVRKRRIMGAVCCLLGVVALVFGFLYGPAAEVQR